MEPVQPATFHGDVPKSFVVPVERPKCSGPAAVALPRETGSKEGLAQRCWSSRYAVELNYVIFLCFCSVCAGVWVMFDGSGNQHEHENSTDPPIFKQKQVVQYVCCSFDCRATMQGIFKTLSPQDKGRDWVVVQIKILHIWTSTKYWNGVV